MQYRTQYDVGVKPTQWLRVLLLAMVVAFTLFALMFKLIWMREVVVNFHPSENLPTIIWGKPKPVMVIKKTPIKPENNEPTPSQPGLEYSNERNSQHKLTSIPFAKPGFEPRDD